jgi:hypothetical protein
MTGSAHMGHRFRHPFRSLHTINGGKEGLYVIGAMFTAAYSKKAERLAASCEKFGLPYVTHEVPAVHLSRICSRHTGSLFFTWTPIVSSYPNSTSLTSSCGAAATLQFTMAALKNS